VGRFLCHCLCPVLQGVKSGFSGKSASHGLKDAQNPNSIVLFFWDKFRTRMPVVFQEKKFSDTEIFDSLHPLLSQWFRESFGKFTEPQRFAILDILHRKNTLVSAETGTGKTLSAFTAILSELMTLSEMEKLEKKVYCVYVSPLRALSNDIHKNLLEPLHAVQEKAEKNGKKIDIPIALRTGDTTTTERARMLRHPPAILITTPESLAILLNAPKFRELLKETQWVIIDEIHSLAEGKRGVHLSLSMERLQRLAPQLCRIGLSATVAPLESVAEFLVGFENGKPRNCQIVNVSFLKKTDLKVLSPLPDLINTTQQKIQSALYEKLDQLISEHKTTLVFTNTRAATERVVHHLKESFPQKYLQGNLGAHHSSLSRQHRLMIENNLKQGKLKAVVCSTSLELGIDIGYIDLVVLLSSPKSVARAIQRMGRSGHRLHDTVKGRLVVLDRDDLVESTVLLKSALEKKIDKLQIPQNCLDVLAQQVFGIAVAETIPIEELWALVRQSYCYHNLDRASFQEVLDYLAGKYASLEVRHVYGKIWMDEETGMIGKKGKLARTIYMTNVGTIPDEAKITVKIKEHKIGSIEEGFLERLKKGDVFVLGGETYEFRFAQGMAAQVVPAYKRPPTVPSWFSEMLPLSFDLAMEIQRFRKTMDEQFKARKNKREILSFARQYLYAEENTANALYEYFHQQFRFSEIPHNKKLLVELYKEGEKRHLVFHSLFGRRTNDALSRAYGFAIGSLIHKDVEITMNDNGFIISSNHKMPFERAIHAVKSSELRKVLEMAIEKTEILGRRFRHCATRGLMILRTYKGRTKSAGRQQLSSRLLLSAVKRLDNNFAILREARREVLEDLMDIQHAQMVVKAIEEGLIEIKKIDVSTPSPFAFNLFLQGYTDILKMEDRLAFIKRMHERVMQQIGEKETEESA
jgi:ATP-dependent Lhr-like helicase